MDHIYVMSSFRLCSRYPGFPGLELTVGSIETDMKQE